MSKEREELVLSNVRWDPEAGRLKIFPPDPEHAKYRAGGKLVAEASAPGHGRIVYQITRVNALGVHGIEIENTIHVDGDEPEEDDPAPVGYARVKWDEVKPDDMVFICGQYQGEPFPYGPHLVAHPKGRILKNRRGITFPHYPEDLLKYVGA